MESRVVIVGSSDNVTSRGAEVDAFEHIVRCNRAPVEGWEDKVGSRTTHRVVNPTYLYGRSKEGMVPLSDIHDTHILCIRNTEEKDFYKMYHSSCTLGTYRKDKWLDVCRSWGIEVKNKTMNATVGFDAICLFAHLQPVIYGFDLEVNGIFNHYWEEQKRNSTFHDHDQEKVIIREMIEREIILTL